MNPNHLITFFPCKKYLILATWKNIHYNIVFNCSLHLKETFTIETVKALPSLYRSHTVENSKEWYELLYFILNDKNNFHRLFLSNLSVQHRYIRFFVSKENYRNTIMVYILYSTMLHDIYWNCIPDVFLALRWFISTIRIRIKWIWNKLQKIYENLCI